MDLLKGRRGWLSILLARAGTDDPSVGSADKPATETGDAWAAWRRAVTTMTPEAVIRAVGESGLRGRGGGAFPTGQKWRACRAAGGVRHMVANGFEADPGTQLDRTLMERSPQTVLEGTALAAFAVGAMEATIVVGAGASLAASRLRTAIARAERAGYIGENVLQTGASLWIDVRELTGSFVVGEETVLLRALEEKRAQPDQRPPFPSERGLQGRPTAVNNVETLAAVPWIVANGPSAYAAIGDPEEPGTTLVQISGAVPHAGILEVPTGTSLRTILEVASGAAPPTDSPALKALLVGGPSGGFLPATALDTPLSHGPLVAAGAIPGSGSIVAIDSSSCIVELATLMTRYLNDQACGKTIPCRIGTRRLAELGDGFCTGRCRPTDPELLRELAADVRDAALCGLEATAVNPLLSGMRYFAQEFEDHIVRGSCPAGVCRPVRAAAAAAVVG